MALLDSSQSQDISGYRIFTMPQASLSAEQAVADPQAPHLLVCSNDASYVLSTIYEAGASAKLLQETALVD